MKKETEFTAREMILAKADVTRNMPEYRPLRSFDEFTAYYWRFDADKYESDSEYAKEVDTAYAHDNREREAYNAVLDMVYAALA